MDDDFGLQRQKPSFQQLTQSLRKSDIITLHKIMQALQPGQLVNATNKDSQTPFWYLSWNTDQDFGIKAIDLLADKGANPYHKDINKQTFLFWLSKLGSDKILQKALSKFQFKLNDVDYMDQNPIYYAAVGNHYKCCDLLIKHGADVNHKDLNGQTPLYYAARQGHLDICKLLIDNGCNPLHHDKTKKTASFFAKSKNHKHIVQFLNGYKNQAKRNKIIQKSMDSSQTQNKRGRNKKEVVKAEYCLVYTNQNGQTHELTNQQIQKFRETSEQYAKLIKFMENPDRLDLQPLPQEKRYEKVAIKILNQFWKQQNAYLFHQPVDYIRYNLKDYTTIIKHPMDFGTIKTKLSFNAYHDSQQFKNDMNLVFDNCILYNGKDSFFGRVAMQMKHQFNATASRQLYGLRCSLI